MTWRTTKGRSVARTRFLEQYPESPVLEPVRARHRGYLALYLGGTDNTPAFDSRSGLLRPDLRRAFEAYAAAHSSRPSGRVVAEHLALLRAGEFRENPGVGRLLQNLRDSVDSRLARY
jgi:hypothetical protein